MSIPFDPNSHDFRSPGFRRVIDEAVDFFVKTPCQNLPPSVQFNGPGVYALYYTGPFELYRKVADLNRIECEQPIYVGKAVPQGWRKGKVAVSASAELYRRLKDHALSLDQAQNLNRLDFKCRLMILNGPQSSLISVPSTAMLVYAAVYLVAAVGFAAWQFSTRDL